MKQFISLSLLFTFVLVLLAPSLASAVMTPEAFEIPYQINNTDRIVVGTVSQLVEYSNYTIVTITVKEWLYNPLPTNTIRIRTEIGTNGMIEDEAEFKTNESVLLMLKDEVIDKYLFRLFVGYAGKHPISDRDAVIKELKAQGKWKEEKIMNSNGIEIGTGENSDNNSFEIAGSIPQRLPLTFGPSTLNKLKSDPDFIAAYGSISNFSTPDERDKWINTLIEVTEEVNGNTDLETSKYFYPKGPIISYGANINGVLEVGIIRNETVNKSFLDGIYQFFDSKAQLLGIKEVPVVFVYEDLPVPTVIMAPVNKTSNITTSVNNSSSGNESSKNHPVPGFGLSVGLMCLYIGWKLRKR